MNSDWKGYLRSDPGILNQKMKRSLTKYSVKMYAGITRSGAYFITLGIDHADVRKYKKATVCKLIPKQLEDEARSCFDQDDKKKFFSRLTEEAP